MSPSTPPPPCGWSHSPVAAWGGKLAHRHRARARPVGAADTAQVHLEDLDGRLLAPDEEAHLPQRVGGDRRRIADGDSRSRRNLPFIAVRRRAERKDATAPL